MKWRTAFLAVALASAAIRAQVSDSGYLRDHFRQFIVGRKLNPENHPQTKGTVAAWIDRDSLHLVELDFICSLMICGRCEPTRNAGRAFKLPGPPTSAYRAFALIKGEGSRMTNTTGTGLVRATAVVVMASGVVYRLRAEWSPDRVTMAEWTPAAMSFAESGQVPAFAMPASDVTTPADSGVLVMGSRGLFTRLEWRENGLNQWVLPSHGEDFQCHGGRYVGTRSGSVLYFKTFPDLFEAARPFTDPVLLVDSTGALAANGKFASAYHNWTPSTIPSAPYRAFEVVRDERGINVNLWNDATVPQRIFLKDEPTYLENGTWPGEIGGHINAQPVVYRSTPLLSFILTVKDAEENYDAPDFRLIRGTESSNLSGEFRKSIPSRYREGALVLPGCVGTGVCIEASFVSILVHARADSFDIQMPVRRGAYSDMCKDDPYFQGVRDGSFQIRSAWKSGDRLVLRIGADSLEVDYGEIASAIGSRAERSAYLPAFAGKSYEATGRILPGAETQAGKGKNRARFVRPR